MPAVCLVLEGGPGTLETVKSAIQSGTPAVIVEGSGRAADILAFAYNNSREEEVEVQDKLGRTYKQYVFHGVAQPPIFIENGNNSLRVKL